MAGEDYTSDGSTFHPTLNLVLDGEVYNFESIQKSATPKRGLFAKLLDNVTYVKKAIIGSDPGQLGSIGVPDGATLIGVAAITAISWAGGNLRALLASLGDMINAEQDSDGGTLPQADHTILLADLPTRRTHFLVPALLASYAYKLPTGEEGRKVTFRLIGNPPYTVTIKRPDNTIIAISNGQYRYDGSTTVPWYQFIEVTVLGGVWVVTGALATDPITPNALSLS